MFRVKQAGLATLKRKTGVGLDFLPGKRLEVEKGTGGNNGGIVSTELWGRDK